MSTPTLTWPDDLRISAAIRPLATALYVAHMRADGRAPLRFSDLSVTIKRFYDELALTELRGLTHRPGYFEVAIRQAKAARDKVVGVITPSEPYGVDPRD